MEKNVLERYGSLKKIEPLRLITDEAVDPNTLAFECPSPFPGYYGAKPAKDIPLYIYFVLDDYMHLEDLLLIKEAIKQNFSSNFHATLAHLSFFDERFHAIRIRNVENFGIIRALQQLFIDQGVVFKKKTRKYKFIDRAAIRIKKFFQVEEGAPGIYCDLEDAHHGYFSINQHLSLNNFVEIARNVAYNLKIIDYDAALACFYHNYKVHDLIRIYTDKNCLELLKQIREEYRKKLEKL